MAKLIFSAITSLDGYIEDEAGSFDWATPDDEVFGFLNELERPVGTYLYGRRMYETLVYWETADVHPDQSPVEWDWMQLWRQEKLAVVDESSSERSGGKVGATARTGPRSRPSPCLWWRHGCFGARLAIRGVVPAGYPR